MAQQGDSAVIQDLVVTVIKYGRIFAVVNLPSGIYLWDLFAWTCLRIGDNLEASMVNVFEWLDPILGTKSVQLAEFVSRVAADCCPQA